MPYRVENIVKKKVCKKEKLPVTSNFSFSHNVFHSYTCISLVRQNAALCGSGLIMLVILWGIGHAKLKFESDQGVTPSQGFDVSK